MKTKTAEVLRRVSHKFGLLLATLALIATTSAVQIARAQSESGSAAIEGVTLDANGAVVSGATITIRDVERKAGHRI